MGREPARPAKERRLRLPIGALTVPTAATGLAGVGWVHQYQTHAPEAADRWTWLLLLVDVQLRLARDPVADVRLPCQRPLPLERRTPARVRRGFSPLHVRLGTPASVPKPCGRSPGRPKGKRSRPTKRVPAVKLTP